jgi:superfamily II DNA helicase RecQ
VLQFTQIQHKAKMSKAKFLKKLLLNFTKVIFITAEKLCLSKEFQYFISNMYNKLKVRFVIEEAHCILGYSNFR